MAGWRRVVELAMTGEEIERLTALSRSRTEPASRVSRAQMLLAYGENPCWPMRLREEITADYNDMIYAATREEIEPRRKAFIRKWRLKHRAVADSLEEAGERLFTFTRLPPSQWKSARTTNAIERLHEEFKRRIKTQTVLPSADTAAMLFWAFARFRPDQHAQGRWLTNPRHQTHRSAN
jgi:transposase-like protein